MSVIAYYNYSSYILVYDNNNVYIHLRVEVCVCFIVCIIYTPPVF